MIADSVETPSVQQGRVFILAPPERVYALVSDVTRTGEWSPECRRCRWVDGATGPAVGARFRGYNRYRWLRWSRLNEITEFEPAREFAFCVLKDWFNRDSSLWRYSLQPKDDGTLLSESTTVLAWPGLVVRFLTFLAGRRDDMTPNIATSLQRIKQIAELDTAASRQQAS